MSVRPVTELKGQIAAALRSPTTRERRGAEQTTDKTVFNLTQELLVRVLSLITLLKQAIHESE